MGSRSPIGGGRWPAGRPRGRPAGSNGGSGVAGVRQGGVRERVRERLVVVLDAVRALAQQLEGGVGGVRAEPHREQAVRALDRRRDQPVDGQTREGGDLDVGHVVTEAATVRVAVELRRARRDVERGISTSLTSGWPGRSTRFHCAARTCTRWPWRRRMTVFTTRRSVAAQTPITGCAAERRSRLAGTSSAMVWTFTPARLSVPGPPTLRKSKMRPTSMANGSSRGPTNTLTWLPVLTAEAASAA